MQVSASRSGYERLLKLCELSGRELDERFRASGPGPLPDGPAVGVALALPGTPVARPLAHAVRALAWQGKVFDAARGDLVNRIFPFRVEAIRAAVYEGPSWFDGRPCIVLDYSTTSLVASMVRDEIREIEPGLWLGLVYVWRARVLRFALAF